MNRTNPSNCHGPQKLPTQIEIWNWDVSILPSHRLLLVGYLVAGRYSTLTLLTGLVC